MRARKHLFTGHAAFPTLQHCNPVQGQYRARTGFSLCTNSHREKPVFITGNPCSHCREPVFITGISLRELEHTEIPLVITGNGFAVKNKTTNVSKVNCEIHQLNLGPLCFGKFPQGLLFSLKLFYVIYVQRSIRCAVSLPDAYLAAWFGLACLNQPKKQA